MSDSNDLSDYSNNDSNNIVETQSLKKRKQDLEYKKKARVFNELKKRTNKKKQARKSIPVAKKTKETGSQTPGSVTPNAFHSENMGLIQKESNVSLKHGLIQKESIVTEEELNNKVKQTMDTLKTTQDQIKCLQTDKQKLEEKMDRMIQLENDRYFLQELSRLQDEIQKHIDTLGNQNDTVEPQVFSEDNIYYSEPDYEPEEYNTLNPEQPSEYPSGYHPEQPSGYQTDYPTKPVNSSAQTYPQESDMNFNIYIVDEKRQPVLFGNQYTQGPQPRPLSGFQPRSIPPLTKLQSEEQRKKEEMAKITEEIKKINQSETDIKERIVLSNLNINIKASVILRLKNAGITEYSKTVQWASSLLKIPFNKYKSLPIKYTDGPKAINKFLTKRQNILNNAVYGLDDTKEQIIEFLSQMIRNPKSKGNILALQGPPGVGKTKLIKSGISEALGRHFDVINFGGMKDSALLDGHDMTYVGAKYGRIVQILINAGYMNPVIYLDEVDKIPEQHFDEISGLLTHMLDEEQNQEFFDNYFQGVPIDISKVLFVVSFNSLEKISHIVSDRMNIIKIADPSLEDKISIGQKYLLPELLKEVGLKQTDITVSKEILKYIILHKTEKEKGVRKFKKTIHRMIQKLNTLDLISGTSSKKYKLSLSYKTGCLESVSLPVDLDKNMVDILLSVSNHSNIPSLMYT